MEDKIDRLTELIRASERIVFFGGAGVSTESGVPDFRSSDGLYNQHDIRFEHYTPEYLLSHTCLVREPAVFYEFYRQKMDTRSVLPNAAHLFLSELERQGKLLAVVTQNIDGLHQRAGSRAVYEIHGSTERNYCMSCGKRFSPDTVFDSSERIPRCSCGGQIRCDVTLYEETLPEEAVDGAVAAISSADLLIIGGTSLTVWPAASYVRYFRGKALAVINRSHLELTFGEKVLEINAPIGEVFSRVRRKLMPDAAEDRQS